MVNKLVSIVTDADKKWVRHFPPMPTKRHSTNAVTTNQYLIVGGGERRSVLRNTVEVMDWLIGQQTVVFVMLIDLTK